MPGHCFNAHGDNWSRSYGHPMVGILFGGGQAYATCFSDDPAWIYGIQWLPVSPMLEYLGRDREHAGRLLEAMLRDRRGKGKSTDIASMGTSLGNVVLGYVLQFDPAWVAAQMGQLWAKGDPIARDTYTGGLTYDFAHARRMLGARAWDWHVALPTGAVYYNARTKVRPYCAWNARPYPRLVDVYRPEKPVGRLLVPARAMVRATRLRPLDAPWRVIATVPAGGAKGVTRWTERLYVLFTDDVDPGTLAAAKIAGQAPIHCACQSAGASRPVTKRAGCAAVDSASVSSHT